LSGRFVVLVEDDRLVSSAMSAWLASQHMFVRLFSDAGRVLQSPAVAGADFFIVDARLPGSLSGTGLLEELERRIGQRPRAILLSGDPPESLKLPAGFPWPVFQKPIPPETLLQALLQSLEATNKHHP
jgi:FixJ family two-component response regulator